MDMYFAGVWLLAGLSAGVLLLLLLAGFLVLAFEIWALVHLIKNAAIPPEQKVLWAVGMFLIHPFVAIAYFFYERSRPAGP